MCWGGGVNTGTAIATITLTVLVTFPSSVADASEISAGGAGGRRDDNKEAERENKQFGETDEEVGRDNERKDGNYWPPLWQTLMF